jgi:hypothetical protein
MQRDRDAGGRRRVSERVSTLSSVSARALLLWVPRNNKDRCVHIEQGCGRWDEMVEEPLSRGVFETSKNRR